MMHILFSGAGFEIHSAPVLAGLSGLAAFLYFRSLRPYTRLSEEDLWGLLAVMALGVMAGAAVFYIFAYGNGPAENLRYMAGRKKIPGGSFWGAFWAAAAFSFAYCRVKKIESGRVADALALSALLALPIMRLGCLMNGCCYGSPTALPWAIRFTDPQCGVSGALLGLRLHPSQLYEAAGSLAIFLAAHFLFLRRSRLAPGGVFALAVASYSVLRFCVDFTRGGDPGLFSAYGLSTAQYVSTLSAAGSIIWYRLKKS